MYIRISGLSFRYSHRSPFIIKDCNLSIAQGEIVAVLGPSGSGKTTLLRLIAGLELPTSGSIVIGGRVMSDKTHFVPPEKRGVGMVFQDYALFPHMTVSENIQFGLRHLPRRERLARMEEMLNLVNLTEYKNRYPYELSGGQQQRVALARSLAPAPSLLMLDEPFSHLDTHLQQQIRDELRHILKQTGTTSIFVTHNDDDAKVLADRLVHIDKGIVRQDGSASSGQGSGSYQLV
jgi:iron(III) transport system ATP-binding protein